jgi:hypothetical protein
VQIGVDAWPVGPRRSEAKPMSDGEGWRAVVDARLIDACERHERGAAELRREPSLPRFVREHKLRLEPSDWGAGYLQVREREIPSELQQDLHELMPQALLRDLYRPVHELGFIERAIVEGTGDRGGVQAMAAARAARTRPERTYVEPGTRVVRAYQIWRRELYAERWQPILGDDEPRTPVSI